MFHRLWILSLIGLIPTTTFAQNDVEDLRKEVKALRQEVQELKGGKPAAAVQEKDADDKFIAGHDGGFYLASPTGKFRLNIAGQLQMRYIHNSAEGDTGGFDIRRGKINFNGYLGDPKMKFKLQGAYSSTGTFTLDEGYVQFDGDQGRYLQAGQIQVNFLREADVSSKRQQTVERSNLNSFFRVDKTQGVQVGQTVEQLRWSAAFHDGREATNSSITADSTDIAVTGRAEWLAAGNWKQFGDFAAWAGQDAGILVGTGLDYEIADVGDGLTWDSYWQWTADVSIENDPWNLYGAVVTRQADMANGTDIDQLGFLLQGGIFVVPEKMDLFARWEHIDHGGFLEVKGSPVAIAAGLDDEIDIFTFGTNLYFNKHNSKFVMDVLWAPNGIRQAESSIGTVSSTTNTHQTALRFMYQILF
jgi:hypothetical protein